MEKYYLWLSLLPGIGQKSFFKLLSVFEDPKAVYMAGEERLRKNTDLRPAQIASLVQNKDLSKSLFIIEKCRRLGIKIITYRSSDFPERMIIGDDTPLIIYTIGDTGLFDFPKTIGIVGSRRCTQSDKSKAVECAMHYIDNGWLVISGMAKGIDSYAHTACVNSGSPTVAVLASGLDICYPQEHNRLMECIKKNGLLVSEYPPGTRPERYNFPRRNRIIASLSDDLIVINPGNRSGANITAEYAEKYGKEVHLVR